MTVVRCRLVELTWLEYGDDGSAFKEMQIYGRNPMTKAENRIVVEELNGSGKDDVEPNVANLVMSRAATTF